ncbi:MAG: hypothetical protein ABIQ31_04630 [Ferruginibacter sp.]
MPAKKTPLAKWTIFMLISAENNLFPEMIRNIESLYKGMSGITNRNDVNFIVLVDGLKAWKFSGNFASPALYRIKDNVSFMLDYPEWPPVNKKNRAFANEDLTNPAVLKKFIDYVQKEFPAEQTGFIYKGHGGQSGTDFSNDRKLIEKVVNIPASMMGDEAKIRAEILAQTGMGEDYSRDDFQLDSYSKSEGKNGNSLLAIFSKKRSGKVLSYKVLAKLLVDAFDKKGLGFVFLDCCWGQLIETAYTFSSCTDHFIASADEMPVLGMKYDEFISGLFARPNIRPDEISNLILALFYKVKYFDYDDGSEHPENSHFYQMGVSLTNLYVKEIDAFVSLFRQFSDYLFSNFSTIKGFLVRARRLCLDYTYDVEPLDYGMYNIDLVWFFDNLLWAIENPVPEEKDLKQERQELQKFASDLQLMVIKILRRSFLSSNYKPAIPGIQGIGGQGVTITFPYSNLQLKKSVLSLEAKHVPEFYASTGWPEVIKLFANEVHELFEARKLKSRKWKTPKQFKTRGNKVPIKKRRS